MKKRKTNATFADQDYWNKLDEKDKEWLREFNRKEYYNGKRNHEINDDLFSVLKNVKSINENFDETQLNEVIFADDDGIEETPEYLTFFNSLTKKQKRQFVRILKTFVEKIANKRA